MKTGPPFRPHSKILLCLQNWEGDQKQAMKLARFIADLQQGHSEAADFLFVSRGDCPHDTETIKYVSRKFNVFHHLSRRAGRGWPGGCNDLWFESMSWVYHMVDARKVPAYKAVFTFEADGVPLAPNWIETFSADWDAELKKHPTFVMGAYLKAPGPHINGNAIFSGNPAFTRWLTKQVGGCRVNAGWDYVLYPDFRRWGAHAYEKIRSYWNSKTLPPAAIQNEFNAGVVWMHGIKDDSLLDASRARLLGK
jgi:hypothetical protein